MSKRINLVSQANSVDYPDLLNLQFKSFKKLFQPDSVAKNRENEDLYKIFKDNFPVSDTKGNFILEFMGYSIEDPIYTPEECLQKELTYSVALKIKLRLISKEEDVSEILNQTLFLGNIPYMTEQGSFINNGKERVVVSLVQRSCGVFFSHTDHPSGGKIFSAKIIPSRGVWMEFIVDIYKTMYIYPEKRKKILSTLIFRALGYSKDEDILTLFGFGEKIEATRQNLEANKGRRMATRLIKTYVEEFVDPETGEVISMTRSEILLERDTILDDPSIQTILDTEEKVIFLCKEETKNSSYIIYNTLKKDTTNSEQEAIEELYRQLKNTEPPDEETARAFVNQFLLSSQRTYLGRVGRDKVNKKLGLKIPKDVYELTSKDIIETTKHLLQFIDEKADSDDIDHLSNRRVHLVGEQLSVVLNTAVARMVRIIRERINTRVAEDFKPIDLVVTQILSSAINSFFSTNPLSQYMDQTNPLSAISHKRRISAIKGSKKNVSFDMRNIHYSQYGRICCVETPDNFSIGLVLSFSMYGEPNEMGFIQTPYRKITNGKIDLSGKVHYLTAQEEERCLIAHFTNKIDEKGRFLNKKIKVRQKGNFLFDIPEKASFIDVSSDQIISVATACIPFLENNDAVRALMGSIMQRQAIPLLQSESPIVGTGLEGRIVKDCKMLPVAEKDGTVTYVDANEIIINYSPPKEFEILQEEPKIHKLKKLIGTNQNTCINLKPLVKKGDKVKKGQVLSEGYATQDGQLALGRNLIVAYMSFIGYNFEDGIVISKKVAEMFASVHINEFIIETTDTKLGPEKFTSDIPNVSESQLQNLDKNGIILVGKKVKSGDILVGKVTPKAQTDLAPEALLLQAIFGEKAYNVKDTSLRVKPSFEGTVVDTQLFTRCPRDKQTRKEIVKKIGLLKTKTNKKLDDLKQKHLKTLTQLLSGEKTNEIYDKEGGTLINSGTLITEQVLDQKIFSTKEENLGLNSVSIKHINLNSWVNNESKSEKIKLLLENYLKTYRSIITNYKKEKFKTEIGDDLPPGVLQRVKIRIARKSKIEEGDKMAGRYGNKGIVAKILPKEDMPYFADGTPVDIVLSPLGVPSRMNIGQLYEAILGMAGKKLGKKYAIKPFSAPKIDIIEKELKKAGLPDDGVCFLYDGFTGERFGQKVKTGVVYMLKLNHLVCEKIHARSIGPRTLVMNQPTSGKSNKGGQRIGFMERDALVAHGAAHIIQEMFSIKSDDITGRENAIKSIIKGENLPKPDTPESFKVFQHQLKGLGIEIKLKRNSSPSNRLTK